MMWDISQCGTSSGAPAGAGRLQEGSSYKGACSHIGPEAWMCLRAWERAEAWAAGGWWGSE